MRAPVLSAVVGTVLSKSWGGFFDGARARITEKSFLAGLLRCCVVVNSEEARAHLEQLRARA